jgi:hypothetical protein
VTREELERQIAAAAGSTTADPRGGQPESPPGVLLDAILRVFYGGLFRDGIVDLGPFGSLRGIGPRAAGDRDSGRPAGGKGTIRLEPPAGRLEAMLDGVPFFFDIVGGEGPRSTE